jgi:hypothetical protein
MQARMQNVKFPLHLNDSKATYWPAIDFVSRWPGSEGPRYDCKWSLEQLSWLDWEAATTQRLKFAN